MNTLHVLGYYARFSFFILYCKVLSLIYHRGNEITLHYLATHFFHICNHNRNLLDNGAALLQIWGELKSLLPIWHSFWGPLEDSRERCLLWWLFSLWREQSKIFSIQWLFSLDSSSRFLLPLLPNFHISRSPFFSSTPSSSSPSSFSSS